MYNIYRPKESSEACPKLESNFVDSPSFSTSRGFSLISSVLSLVKYLRALNLECPSSNELILL